MKELSADIVVVGAGPAGLAAAISAAEKDAQVILLEKGSTTGGTGNMGMGPFAVESRLQRLKQIALTREEAFRIFMDYTHWRVDARLVKTYIDKSADTIDWLEKMGVEFVEPATYFPGGNYTWHLVKPSGGGLPGPQSSATMIKAMTDYAKELEIQILLQTPAKRIIGDKEKIAGVIAEDRNGEDIQINSNAVILATGGFGDNPDWIKKFTGWDLGKNLFSHRIPGLIGDGIRMAWEMGAGATEINMELTYNLPGPGGHEIAGFFHQPGLLVNLQGERFINEEIMCNTTFTGNAIARQKNNCAVAIFDENTKEHYESESVDHVRSIAPEIRASNITTWINTAIEQGNTNVFIAASLEELAAKMNIQFQNLKNTIEEYNKACETGYDQLFNKKPRYLRPVKKPLFYAGKLYPSGYGTLGGIKINYKTEVITKDFDIISGLFAAGTDACSIYGDSYVFILPGNTMGFALNSGRIAGENASEYVLSNIS